jgi:hypothetical protein
MFRDASRRVAQAADAIGIRGIIVHAISEEARKFYIALGFDLWVSQTSIILGSLGFRRP